MQLLQFIDPMYGRCVGRIDGSDVVDITSTQRDVRTVYDICYCHGGCDIGLAEAVRSIEDTGSPPRRLPVDELLSNEDPARPRIHQPIDPSPAAPTALRIWLAGVTHADSARLREIEARQATGRPVNVYDRKYEECVQGGRPELFPKHDPESVVGPGYPIVRPIDTQRLVPEAELVSVYGRATAGKIVLLGYTAGNDVTDNGMEAMNPLNLPQAKNWSDGCGSIGPVLVTSDEFDPRDVDVSCEVWRSGRCIARKVGRTGSDHLNLRDGPAQMERALFTRFPLREGQLQALFWGTPLVFDESDLKRGLLPGDVVRIRLGGGIGQLENPVIAQDATSQMNLPE